MQSRNAAKIHRNVKFEPTLIERNAKGEWCFKNRPRLTVFYNFWLYLGSELSIPEWEELYHLTNGAIKEAAWLIETHQDEYKKWEADWEKEIEDDSSGPISQKI